MLIFSPSSITFDGVSFFDLQSNVFSSKVNQENVWPKAILGGWKDISKQWKTWVEEMHTSHEVVWKKGWTNNSILNSNHFICCDEEIIFFLGKKKKKKFVLEETNLWLSRFFFLSQHDMVPESVLQLAIHLAIGTKITIAPAVPASLCSNFRKLKEYFANVYQKIKNSKFKMQGKINHDIVNSSIFPNRFDAKYALVEPIFLMFLLKYALLFACLVYVNLSCQVD